VLEDATAAPEDSREALLAALARPLSLPEGARRLCVVPTGTLAAVPFAALWPDREVVLLPSATVGLLLASCGSGAAEVLAVGASASPLAAPLPGAALEAREVGDESLVDGAATEEALRTRASSRPWRALHVAAHGLIDPDRPLHSALALHPTGGFDGLWTAAEVLDGSVRADLVVLSACSAGAGKDLGAEGTLGFVHAFLVAGACRVIASPWDVDDDATRLLMRRLHAELRAGAPAATALHRGQAALRAEERWSHPAHWAGWQLWGGR
jgi:CHAT domain-containing protein